MATPAAVLGILVEANTRPATASLTKMNATLTKTQKTATMATGTTSKLNTASRTLGSTLGSAAKYAVGAAAAYLSIAQAKAAVTTTQDLAKATLGLQANLGLAGRQAGEWAAVARARGVDTTKLTMSFKALSTQVEAAKGGSEEAIAMFRSLGLSMADVRKGSTDVQGLMLGIADGMDQAGAGTQRVATASKLFGRSWSSIAPLIRDGSDALEENLKATEKYGAALHGQTLKDQAALRSELIESKMAWTGLQVTFTKLITPALGEVNDQFQKIAEVMADKRLTDDEKFKRIGEMIQEDFSKALDFVVKLIPVVAAKVGEAAPKIAVALVQGFLNADGLGRLFIGGWFLSKMGGIGAFRSVGGRAGSAFGTGFVGRGAAGAGIIGAIVAAEPLIEDALTKIFGEDARSTIEDAVGIWELPGLIRDQLEGPGVKPVEVTDFFRGDVLGEFSERIFESRKQLAKTITVAKEAGAAISHSMVDAWQKAGKISEEEAERIHKAIRHVNREARFDEVQSSAREFTDEIARSGDVGERELKQLGRNIEELRGKSKREYAQMSLDQARALRDMGAINDTTFRKIRDTVRDEMGTAARDLKNASEQGRSDLVGNFTAMARGGTTAIAKLAQNMNNALDALGVKKVDFNISQVSAAQNSGNLGSAVDVQKKQTGGVLVPGSGSGDKVHAMLEPGEVVWNREAVKAMGGAKKANQVNQRIPRFAQGGVAGELAFALGPYNVPPIQYDANHAGGNSHWHISGTTSDWVVAVGKQLQQMGFMVGEHPAFGGVSPVHGHYGPTDHYHGGAIDVNSTANETLEETKRVAALISSGSITGAVAEKLKRIILEGPDGPMKGLAQATIDKARQAANKYLGQQAPAETPGLGSSAYAGSLDRVFPEGSSETIQFNQAAMLAEMAGMPGITFAQVAQGESSLRPGAVGYDPGGTQGLGLWQITTGFNDDIISKYGGRTQMFNPWVNAQAADDIYDRQGLGAWYGTSFVTDTNAHYTGPMKLAGGGIAGFGNILGSLPGGKKSDIVKGLLEKIKGIGLDPDMEKQITTLTADAAKFDEFASNAGQLTVFPDEGDPIQGVFRDKTEGEWLNDALATLFALRNAIIQAQEIIAKRVLAVAAMIEKAQARLAEAKAKLKIGKEAERNWAKYIAGLKPKDKADLEVARVGLKNTRAENRDNERVISDIGGKIIPGLTGKRSSLVTQRGDLLSSLVTVQGASGPTGLVAGLPATSTILGGYGGDIFRTALSMRNLSEQTSGTVPSSSLSGDSDLTALLRKQLQDANLRYLVSQAQYGVFSGMPYMGAFAKGGVALVGEQGPELAHLPSGTRIHSAADTQAMLGGVTVSVAIFEGEDRARVTVNGETFDTRVERVNRRLAQGPNRMLPGQAGALK